MRYIAGCFCSAVLGGLVVCFLLDIRGPNFVVAQDRNVGNGPTFSQAAAGTRQSALFTQDRLSFQEAINVAVYEKVNKSVVHITTKSSRTDGFFFLEAPAEGTGSGSVIDRAGHVLTNYHVIEDARNVLVALYDGNTYDATLVGVDPINDVAIIKIDAPEQVLVPTVFGNSATLKVGMCVYAIGNPFGLERTLTTGIISSLNRSLQLRGNRTIKSIIQTDAAINPGSSGGPLLDTHGRLIGMNTAIASKTGQSSGVGFAIPVNLIARVVPQLIMHGRVIRPEIGIQRVYETEQGLLVAQITQNGPAERAGIRGPRIERRRRGPFIIERIDRSAADMIVAIDGKEAKTADDFLDIIERKKPNEEVVLTVIRNGRQVDVRVRLGGGTRPGQQLPATKL